MSTGRTLAVIVAGIAGILGLTVLVVVLAGQRAPVDYPAGSPEAAVQVYLRAFEADDVAGAYAAFSTKVQEGMGVEEYRRAVDDYRRYSEPPGGARRSVFISGTRGNGERTLVDLTVEEVYDSGLGIETYRSSRAIAMIHENGSWKIDEPLVWLDPGSFLESPNY